MGHWCSESSLAPSLAAAGSCASAASTVELLDAVDEGGELVSPGGLVAVPELDTSRETGDSELGARLFASLEAELGDLEGCGFFSAAELDVLRVTGYSELVFSGAEMEELETLRGLGFFDAKVPKELADRCLSACGGNVSEAASGASQTLAQPASARALRRRRARRWASHQREAAAWEGTS